MGNRAVITTYKGGFFQGSYELGVYVHWNGGYSSVAAFLKFCELKGYRKPEIDNYGWARLCQVIGNFFGGDDTVGIDGVRCLDCDNGDNGVYVIEGWKIVGRKFHNGPEQLDYEPLEMLNDINEAMPEKERLTADLLEKGAKALAAEYERVKQEARERALKA